MSTVPTDLEMPGNGTTGSQPAREQELPAWKRELNEKIAAARSRRQAGTPNRDESHNKPTGEVLPPGEPDSRSARVAAAVAARYAQAPTYREYLASEVRTAMEAAVLAQEAAAHAVAEAEQARAMVAQLTAPLASPAPEAAAPLTKTPGPAQPPAARVDYEASGIPSRPVQNHPTHSANYSSDSRPGNTHPPGIADPLAEAIITPSTPLPANLLEFPRELIAARKARPRHAEGPLRDEDQGQPQLRIFEVEPQTISTQVESAPLATEWSSIRLGAHPTDVTAHAASEAVSSNHPESTYTTGGAYPRHIAQRANRDTPSAHGGYARDREALLMNVASVGDRLMAAIVDACLVGIAFLLFVFVFTASTVHPPSGKPAIIGSAIVLASFYLLYQLLFFTFADGTPGMLYARIALCTFDDDNPTRTAMRKRIFAVVLAGMPLGLGFLYALFDEDHLGWHDRMTRMYQRSYE